MDDVIRDIRDRLRAGEFSDEVAVALGIVWPILNALSWPVASGNVVRLSHSLPQGRRVDFALCHPPGQPMVFIEVKQAGRASAGERQLMSDAAQHGVPLAVLTTGREWRFCLPGDSCDNGDGCVAVLDLLALELDETIARLQTYLDYRAVTSGVAIKAARADYREIARQREIQRTLPEAWQQLVEEQDELLLELIADADARYAPDVILFESNAAFAGVRDLLVQQAHYGGKVLGVTQSRSKRARLEALSVSVQNQRFCLRGQRVGGYTGVHPAQQELYDQLTAFPQGDHDDLADAAATAVAYLLQPRQPRVW